MPAVKGKAPFNLGAALARHASDPTDYGQDFSRPPAPIGNGVARLVAASIGVYKTGANTGEQFVRLAGAIAEPTEALDIIKGIKRDASGKPVMTGRKDRAGRPVPELITLSSKTVRCQGLQTSLMLPLCATATASGDATSADENVATLLNELRKLGGEECTAEVSDEASLGALLKSLVDAGPYFRFSTNRPDPTLQYPDSARVFERWYGGKSLEDYQPPSGGGVRDRTAPSTNGDTEEEEVEDRSNDNADGALDAPPDENLLSDPPDFDALVAAADDKNARAQTRLRELAAAAGAEEGWMDADDTTWQDIADRAQASEETGEGEEAEGEAEEEAVEEEPEEPEPPRKGNRYDYKPLDPKTKKRGKKIEVEVLAVDKRKQVCDVKSPDTRKIYKGVPWSALTT